MRAVAAALLISSALFLAAKSDANSFRAGLNTDTDVPAGRALAAEGLERDAHFKGTEPAREYIVELAHKDHRAAVAADYGEDTILDHLRLPSLQGFVVHATAAEAEELRKDARIKAVKHSAPVSRIARRRNQIFAALRVQRLKHAVDAAPARWRGDAGLSPLDFVHSTHRSM